MTYTESLTRPDNAQQESFWSTLKTEFYHRHSVATRAEAITATSAWMDEVSNHRRRHSSLGYLSPVAFENTHITAAAKAA